MSAWIVSKKHIDCIVKGISDLDNYNEIKQIVNGDNSLDTLNKIGQILWDECFKSVNYRYNDNEKTPVYKYDNFTNKSDNELENLGFLFKQVQCLDYQSCEHPEYDKSTAKKIIDKLTFKIGYKMSELACPTAPWGIE